MSQYREIKHYREIYSKEHVSNCIRLLAYKLDGELDLTKTVILVMLTGGDYLFNHLVHFWRYHLPMEDLEVEFIKGHFHNSSQQEEFVWDMFPNKEKLQDKDILVIDDFADSGNTINITHTHLKDMGVKSITFATLLKRYKCQLTEDVKLFYPILINNDEFLVGCGLDDNGKSRYIDYIGSVS